GLSAQISSLLSSLVVTQIQTMIFGGGILGREVFSAQAYVEGYDMFADFGELIPPLTVMPTRFSLQAIRHNKTMQSLYTGRVLPSLNALAKSLYATMAALHQLAPQIPANARFLFDDLLDSATVTLLRTQQIINLYDYLTTNSSDSLSRAQEALDWAAQVVSSREAQYSVPLDRVAGWRFNPTCYKYTYLWTVKSLYFWWRDEAISTADTPVSPCFRNIQNPLQESTQFPGIDVATLVLQYLRDHYADTEYQVITNCLDSPIKEPCYNRSMTAKDTPWHRFKVELWTG
ncbi:MAG: hypothetical protein Q8P67_26785, partial [archaeon]|nr:hypothetical protein [archaeon]